MQSGTVSVVEALRESQRIAAEAELGLARSVREWAGVEGWKENGARSAKAWLVWQFGYSIARARQILALARTIGFAPLETAIVDGTLSIDKAVTIASVCTNERAAWVDEGLRLMIRGAQHLQHPRVVAMTEHWANLVDQQLHDTDGPAPRPHSELRTAEQLDGTLAIQGKLSMSDAELFQAALDAAMRALNPDDEHHPEDGHETTKQRKKKNDDDVPVDQRTLAQKRGAALVAMAEFFLKYFDKPVTRFGERPNLNIVVPVAVLEHGEGVAAGSFLIRGLHPEDVRQIACDCNITRILTLQGSETIDVGRKTRVISPALRKAVSARDGGHCRFPGCHTCDRYVDIHHLVHWINGGCTDQANCILLCRYHHGLVHHGGWTTAGTANGELTFTSPTGTHHTTRPPGHPPPLTLAFNPNLN